jgi:hypothetical protein
MDAIKDIPQVEKPLLTESGPAKLQKTDIFRKLMWFSYNNDNDWHSITCDRVREIQALNDQGIKVFNLQVDKSSDVVDLAAQSTRELELLDKKFTKKKKKKSRNKTRPEGQTNQDTPKPTQGQNNQTGSKPQNSRPQNRKPNPTTPPQQKVQENKPAPKAELKEGVEPRKKRNKNRNRPKPTGNQDQNPKPQNQEPKPNESKTQGNRKFPPRRNQGPNNDNNG